MVRDMFAKCFPYFGIVQMERLVQMMMLDARLAGIYCSSSDHFIRVTLQEFQ